MSEKQTCPKCDSHTSSVHRAWLDGEPCPYCDDDLTRLPTPPCPTCGRPLAADSRPVVSEAAIEAAAVEIQRLIQGWMNYNDEDWPMLARGALAAALPHMGDGKGEAFTDSLEPEIAESWADEEYRNVWLAAAWDECCREHERECDDLTYDDSGNVIDTGCDRNPYRLSPTGDDR